MITIHSQISFTNVLIVAAAVSLSGCSSWPEHGHGGDVQVDTTRQYYLDQIDDWMGVPLESKGAMENQWSLHNLKLDTLVLRGAKECIPARVREVVLISHRARRELDGNLLEDARNTLVIMHREVDELERRLIYIKRHTHCVAASQFSGSAISDSKRIRYVKYQLSQLLNTDHAFENDDDQLSLLYRERILVASRYLKQFPQLTVRLNGHTDSNADYDYNQDLSLRRAKAVEAELISQQIDPERIEVRAFGEHLPRDTNQTWQGRMSNRRVHVEIIEPTPTLEYFYREMDMQFGLHGEATAKTSVLKHWQADESERFNQSEADAKKNDSLNREFPKSHFGGYHYHQSMIEGE